MSKSVFNKTNKLSTANLNPTNPKASLALSQFGETFKMAEE